MKKKMSAYILIVLGIAALASGLFLFCRSFQEEKKTKKLAEDALIKIREMIPEKTNGFIYEKEEADNMPVLEINGLSLVGYIEIPDIDTAFVVQNQWGNESVTRMKQGNVSEGTGVIETDQIDFNEIKTGMTITFVDINGIVYDFIVDYIGNENDIVHNAKLILFAEGMTKAIQIACIEK